MPQSNKPDDPPANLPTDIEQQVEELAERFLDELQQGKSPDREQWVNAHPQIAQWLAARLELVEKMFRMVHGSGPRGSRAADEDAGGTPTPHQPAPSPHPPERAIHLKCPHCGNRIQLVEPKAQEVLCENCGSSFELDPGTTTTYRPDDLPKAIGRFQVLELLGRGGFGAVYKARDAELDRTVAIKVPRAGYFGTQQEQERFLREARSAARLKHPNIVPVHEIGHDRGVPYIVSDYVEGLTLADLLTAGRPTFRESAELVARIADALDYAHREKVVHRDIKPSNILMQGLGVRGQGLEKTLDSLPSSLTPNPQPLTPFLTDFGLARRDEGEITVTLDGQVLGTPAYMPPEQAAGDQRKVDARSDVYSLGVVLYERLTGELPFRGNKRMLLHQVLNDDPRPPRSVNDRIPRDLETICLKAMAKEPARRYATARELADDLRRYLTGDPIDARPVSKTERLWRWCRRNPWPTAVVLLLVVSLAGANTAGSQIIITRAKAVAAKAREDAALAREAVAVSKEAATRAEVSAFQARENDRKREALLQQVQRVRQVTPVSGWSLQSWEILREAAQIRIDDELRNQAATTLAGIDARIVKRFEFDASSVAFDVKGNVLIGGMTGIQSGDPTETAKLWDGGLGEPLSSNKAGAGPVTFRADGTALQLVRETDTSLVLWNVNKQEAMGEFKLPAPEESELAARVEIIGWELAGDGSLVAASAARLDEGGRPAAKTGGIVAVWSSESGKLLHKFDMAATALALSPNVKLLAAGDDSGGIVIRSLSNGERVASLVAGRNTINCLAFGRDPLAQELVEPHESEISYRLAAGDAGGSVTIWDHAGRVQSYCQGSSNDVFTVAFSPDGTVLASAGRAEPRLWDVATGRQLLMFKERGYTTGLAFSLDGRKLAVCGFAAWGPGGVDVWDLDDGRGLQTLRGLVGQIPQVYFSLDGRLVAALSRDWQLGIWEVATGRLVRILDTPRGAFVGNAAVALNHDATLIAFAAGSEARVWEVATGEVRKSVTLPPGLSDIAGFHDGKLLLFRVETRDGKLPPDSRAHPKAHPRVCRIRNLLADDPTRPLATIEDFNWGVFTAAAPPNGSYFVVEGCGGPEWRVGENRWIKAYDGLTGEVLRSWDSASKRDGADLLVDPTGDFLIINLDGGSKPTLAKMPSGTLMESLDYSPFCLGPGATYRALHGPIDASGRGRGISLMRRGDKTPIVSLGIDNEVTPVLPSFNADGTQFAWGNSDGTVIVCDIRQVQRNLAAIGLAW